jgi:hypothetical protein
MATGFERLPCTTKVRGGALARIETLARYDSVVRFFFSRKETFRQRSTFLFQEHDAVITLGQDGLVANTAKYTRAQPIIAINPEPSRFDGVLLAFVADQARNAVAHLLEGKAKLREITLAQAVLGDGQRLLGFNELFIGARSYVSALYRIQYGKRSEIQSSSGILVATGAGSTGWASSLFNMASGIAEFCGGSHLSSVRMEWEDSRLLYLVREPFLSRHSEIGMVAGMLAVGEELVIESRMAERYSPMVLNPTTFNSTPELLREFEPRSRNYALSYPDHLSEKPTYRSSDLA